MSLRSQSAATVPVPGSRRGTSRGGGTAGDPALVGRLHEVIAALDRRRPQPRRADWAVIARRAAELRRRALERLAELEREAPRGRSAAAARAPAAAADEDPQNRVV